MLRRLEAMLAIADRETSLIITGNGDVLEPEHGLLAIGSGGGYAQAAALACSTTRSSRRGNREEIARDRLRDLHLHQQEPRDRIA